MPISSEIVMNIFKETQGLLEGHFLLTSGLHSNRYFQCAKVFQYPWHAEVLCGAIAEHFKDYEIDVVVSPAIGGIVVGQETARLLSVRSIFTERIEGKMVFRRGFEISPNEKALVIEDVTTTGGSVKEVIALVQSEKAEVLSVGSVIDRSGGNIDFGIPYFSLLEIEVETYPHNACPLCKFSSPVKPGSRGLNQAGMIDNLYQSS